MWYFGSLFALFICLAACALVGRSIASLLPSRIRPATALYFSPAIGMAVWVLLATAVGWVGTGFHTWLTAPLSAGVLLAALWQQRRTRGLLQHIALMLPVGFVASTGLLFCILRFDSFNPYNDAFCYIFPAQWLQSHSFHQPCAASGYHPVLTMVAVFQNFHLRMGPTFLYGWLQSVFGLQWSYSAYPLVVALPLAVGSMALAGAIHGATGKSRALCLGLGMLAGTSLNGFTFGSLFGFMPQTYGLAFGFSAMALYGFYVACGGRQRRRGAKAAMALPVSLCLAGLIFCYPESAPFVAIGGLVYLGVLAVIQRRGFRQSMVLLPFIAVETAVLVNLESVRAFRALRVQLGAVVGGPLHWSPLDAIMHPGGFLSGPWEGKVWLLGGLAPTILAAGAVLAIAAIGFAANRTRLRTKVSLPFLGVLAVSLAAFLYFRYVAVSPWDGKVGHSWNEFRVSSWASLYVLALIGSGLAAASAKSRLLKGVVIAVAVGWNLAGIVQSYRLADSRTALIRADTHSSSPFNYYLWVRESLKSINPDDGIYLENLGGRYHKHRQMLAYFLYDYKLLSDWSDDNYISNQLPRNELVLPAGAARWILSRTPESPAGGGRVGDLVLSGTKTEFYRGTVEGGYPEESDASGWWRWTANELAFHYVVSGLRPQRVRVKFTYLAADAPGHLRPLTVEFRSGASVQTVQVSKQSGWGQYVSDPIRIAEPEFVLRFSSTEPTERVSATDSRMVAFLIKNLTIEECEPETSLQQVDVKGGYAEESDAEHRWRWTADELRFRFRVVGKSPATARIQFTYLAAARPDQVRPLALELRDGARLWQDKLLMNSGWGTYTSPPVSFAGPEIELRLSTSLPPERAAGADPRMVAFMIQNLKMTVVPDAGASRTN